MLTNQRIVTLPQGDRGQVVYTWLNVGMCACMRGGGGWYQQDLVKVGQGWMGGALGESAEPPHPPISWEISVVVIKREI